MPRTPHCPNVPHPIASPLPLIATNVSLLLECPHCPHAPQHPHAPHCPQLSRHVPMSPPYPQCPQRFPVSPLHPSPRPKAHTAPTPPRVPSPPHPPALRPPSHTAARRRRGNSPKLLRINPSTVSAAARCRLRMVPYVRRNCDCSPDGRPCGQRDSVRAAAWGDSTCEWGEMETWG